MKMRETKFRYRTELGRYQSTDDRFIVINQEGWWRVWDREKFDPVAGWRNWVNGWLRIEFRSAKSAMGYATAIASIS